MSVKHKLSQAVFHARTKRGLKQQEVADAVSITPRWYQQIERGAAFPSSIVLLRLILFLEIDVEIFREEVGLNVPLPSRRRDDLSP